MKYAILLIAILLTGCSVLDTHTLSPGIQGVVLKNGQPIEGAEITFLSDSHWYGKREPQITVSNKNGAFAIPKWTKFAVVTPVHQPVIKQSLLIKYKGVSYSGWEKTRMSYSDRKDSDRSLNFTCDLPKQRSAGNKTMDVCKITVDDPN